jgi:tetratricopeptide (TPR) repeat protein
MTLTDLLTRSWHRILFEVPSMPSRAAAVSLFAAVLTLAACSSNRPPAQADSQLSFGVDMARRGLWKEALFRFEAAERIDPDNPRIQSDLGVAYEASGQFEKALSYYQKALKLDPNDKKIRTNYSRFVEFYQGYKGDKKKSAPAKATSMKHPAAAPAPPVNPGPAEPSLPGDAPPPPTDAPPSQRPPL